MEKYSPILIVVVAIFCLYYIFQAMGKTGLAFATAGLLLIGGEFCFFHTHYSLVVALCFCAIGVAFLFYVAFGDQIKRGLITDDDDN